MEIIEECSSKMSKTIEALHTSLATIRSGKVSPSVLDRILVEYYGEMTPIKAMERIENELVPYYPLGVFKEGAIR